MVDLAKHPPIRDRRYLDFLRTELCIITGRRGDVYETVDPMHIGTAGKGLKAGDDEALPVIHSLHAEGHQGGEISMLRVRASNAVLRAAFRALARELYQEWLKSQGGK